MKINLIRKPILFAIHDDEAVSINSINNNNRYLIYTCDECNEVLIPRIGKAKNKDGTTRLSSFAHKSGNESCSGGEGIIHKYATMLIQEKKYIYSPKRNGKKKKIEFSKVYRKKQNLRIGNSDFECDAKCISSVGEFFIEIYFSNPCVEEKIDYYNDNNLLSVDIDIRKIKDVDVSDIDDYILEKSPRKWIYNPDKSKIEAKIKPPIGNGESKWLQYIAGGVLAVITAIEVGSHVKEWWSARNKDEN
ncbi:MAG: hypothetical protein HQ528_09315 [Candidatus Marinimicrobia bacterium]|nr:hypothetical protein [Candidatus Neomarinimicrobiota bacterium]